MENTKSILIELINKLNKEHNLSEIIDDCIRYIRLISPDTAISLYLFDEDESEFNLTKLLPEDCQILIEKNDEFIDKGILGEVMSTGKPKSILAQDAVYFIVPLISYSGFQGYLITSNNNNRANFEEQLNNIDLIAKILALYVSNFYANIKTNKLKEAIEQQIAIRTLNLVEDKSNVMTKLEQIKTQISFSLPHEIRTPINQILGLSDFMLKYYQNISQEELLDIAKDINSTSKRLYRIFENYLYYTRLVVLSYDLESINQMRSKITYNAELTIQNAIETIASDRLTDFQISLIPINLRIDEEFLQKIILEICDNSIKYSRNGVPIKINSAYEDNLYKISITDYGQGMTKEQLKSIEAFLQFERITNEQQGFGLGLAIAIKIIKIFGGNYKIESQPKKFTCFDIFLPYLDEPTM